jgi:hypothetical protein
MGIIITTYIKRVEDYRDGYDDIPAPSSIEKEREKISNAISSLKNKTLEFSISEQKSNQPAFGVEGRVYNRTAVIKITDEIDIRGLRIIEKVLTDLGYSKVKQV